MGKIPGWYKGQMRECAICGFWYEENSGKMRKQRGIWVDDTCWDTLTDEQRQEMINAKLR